MVPDILSTALVQIHFQQIYPLRTVDELEEDVEQAEERQKNVGIYEITSIKRLEVRPSLHQRQKDVQDYSKNR